MWEDTITIVDHHQFLFSLPAFKTSLAMALTLVSETILKPHAEQGESINNTYPRVPLDIFDRTTIDVLMYISQSSMPLILHFRPMKYWRKHSPKPLLTTLVSQEGLQRMSKAKNAFYWTMPVSGSLKHMCPPPWLTSYVLILLVTSAIYIHHLTALMNGSRYN